MNVFAVVVSMSDRGVTVCIHCLPDARITLERAQEYWVQSADQLTEAMFKSAEITHSDGGTSCLSVRFAFINSLFIF